MIIQLCNGFQEIETFHNIRRIDEGMKRIASYMAKNELRDCNAYQFVNGEQSGKGWRVFRRLDTFFYRVNQSFRSNVKIGTMEELV